MRVRGSVLLERDRGGVVEMLGVFAEAMGAGAFGLGGRHGPGLSRTVPDFLILMDAGAMAETMP